MSSDISHAEAAKRFWFSHSTGVLSTISCANEQYPFGSVTPYDVTEDGDAIIYVSRIAEHWKNLSADPRASLTVVEPAGLHDPQAHARLTVLADFSPIAEADSARTRARYEKRFPDAAGFAAAHDFVFMHGELKRLRWIAGFGSMGWVTPDQLRAAPIDPITYYAPGIIRHMNLEHRDALDEIARAHSEHDPRRYAVSMFGIRAGAMEIQLVNEDEQHILTVPFSREIATPEEARTAVIRVLQEARAKAG